MIKFCLAYLLLFSIIYFLHTKNVQLQDGENGFSFFIGTSLTFSVLAALGSCYAIEIAEHSVFLSSVSIICVGLMIATEFVCCLRIFEKTSPKEVSLLRFQQHTKPKNRIQELLQFWELYQKGLLQEAPFAQGESVYWIDYDISPPKIRQMYFVSTVSDCYLGLSENEKQLIAVPEVFSNFTFAEEKLYAQQWMVKNERCLHRTAG